MAKTILVIDDDKSFLSAIRTLLEEKWYSVRTLSDPWKTEEYIDACEPDLLLIDVVMPGRTGFTLIKDLMEKEKYREIPKIFVSRVDGEEEKKIAEVCGVKKYFVKPVKPEELLKGIEEALR
jgi:DNA-binding response OmpR family regulator